MSVSSITDTSSTLSSYTSSTTGSNTLGEDDFLTLLVAQLQNQDPLDPQDNTEFIAQLAQFSSLEAQTATNDKLDELISGQSSSERTAAFSLLGQQVIVASDSFYLQGDELELGFSLDESAESATISILNEDGSQVASFTLADPQAGYNFISWDGSQLANGTYSMEIDVLDSSGAAVANQPLVKATVDEVALDSSGSILVTDAGNIQFSNVAAVVAQ